MTNNNKIREETIEENQAKSSDGDEIFKCNKCKDKISEVICPCEVAPKYDIDYEEWKNK